MLYQTNKHSGAEVWKEKYCCTFYVKTYLVPSILKYPHGGHMDTWLAFLELGFGYMACIFGIGIWMLLLIFTIAEYLIQWV